MMLSGCRECLGHFNKAYVWEAHARVEVIEKSPKGKGTASFSLGSPAIVLKAHNQPPLIWALSKKKCADGSFVTFKDDKAHLHLVELKSKLTQSAFAKATEQLEGMFLSALAASRLLQIQTFETVDCYVAYSIDAMQPDTTADPALLKTLVGTKTILGDGLAWKNGEVRLPFGVVAKLHKAKRDSSGNADFGNVH
jgi:hypothetical protein